MSGYMHNPLKAAADPLAGWIIRRSQRDSGMQGFERGGGGVTLGHDNGIRLLQITHWIG